MAEEFKIVTDCRVCGADDWLEVYSFGNLPLANSYLEPDMATVLEPRYPLEVIHCRSCALMSLRHVVDPTTLYRDYSYVTSDSRMISNHMNTIAQQCVRRYDVPSGGLVVEMGSNIGTQLVTFQDLGMRVLGIDPAENLGPVAEGLGIPTLSEFFSPQLAADVVARHGRAHLLLGRHVFAHIDDLHDVLRGALTLLAPGGVFVIEVPHLLTMLQQNQFDTIYHEHLSYFSVSTLCRLFLRNGLRIVDVQRADVHGGSILVFAAPQESRWVTQPSVANVLQDEEAFGLDNAGTYRQFAERIDRTTTSLNELVASLVQDGKTIAGYGAPAKGNTLLNICDLRQDAISFCSDTTKGKQGLLLPGVHIPITSPEWARDNPPHYYLLLAWNYAREISMKEFAFLADGGKFIVPIPDVVTLSADVLVDEFFRGLASGR
ncbi:class I SAM-dependent methyltransferase [Polymorphospora rubra]|uniref:class I SAM-dependent methyltransferase n=1 Tax=Polymorphospora rubra TaxID=338584 RepID=UPI0033DB59E6